LGVCTVEVDVDPDAGGDAVRATAGPGVTDWRRMVCRRGGNADAQVARARAAVVLALGLLVAIPAAARAQAAGYGGGSLPYTTPPRTFKPSVGIVLQPRGARLALHFDTLLLCGRTREEAVGRRLVALAGSSFAASGASVARSGRVRFAYAWSLRGTVAGPTVTGNLRITGRRRIGHGRWIRCRRKPARSFQARLATQPAGPAARPRPASSYYGLSRIVIVDGLRAPVVLRTTRDGAKVAARWNAIARCRRGRPERLANFTPATPVRPGGTFARSERFSVRYADALVRYRVRFAGRFQSDGAQGELRMRARVFDRGGRRLRTRCDTRRRRWHALAADTALVPPGSDTTPPPATGGPGPSGGDGRPHAVAGPWSLHLVSEPGDYIGQGGTYAFGPPADRIDASGTPGYLSFSVLPGGTAPDWSAGFFAPQGQTLRGGATYNDTAVYGPGPSDAGMAMSGESRGCNTGVGSFTIRALAFDPNGALRTAKVDWTFRCDPGDPAIRGSWEFQAA
jgi:hypothetical protein